MLLPHLFIYVLELISTHDLFCLVSRVGVYIRREDLSEFLTMALGRKRIGAKSVLLFCSLHGSFLAHIYRI